MLLSSLVFQERQLHVVLLRIDEVLLGLNLGMELLGVRVLLHHVGHGLSCGLASRKRREKKMLKEGEKLVLAGLVFIVDSRTNFMLAGTAVLVDLYSRRHPVGARHWFGLQYLF